MKAPGYSAHDYDDITAQEEKLLSDLQATLDVKTLALYEQKYAEVDSAELPRITAVLKLQILNLARMTLDILNTAEFLVEENDHLKAEMAILKNVATQCQEQEPYKT